MALERESRVPTSSVTTASWSNPILRLTLQVRQELLRAVRLHKVLSHFGYVWGTSAGDETTYAMSEPVERIEDFISHDWRTPRWKKVITLCYVYNTVQAILGSVVASAVTSILIIKFNIRALSFPNNQRSAGVEAHFTFSYIPIIVGFVTFLFFFVFWQQIRAHLPGTPRLVFVDKVCINQTNREAKNAGILGLGGFIHCSDSLLIMWSPRYFSRLWCVYEVATWLHIHPYEAGSGHGRVTLLPVGFIVGALSYMVSVLIFRVCTTDLLTSWLHIVISVILAGLGPCLAVMTIDSDRRLLEEQVASFSAEKSGCFCCQVNHVDPKTGAPMICDRKLVYDKLSEWFPEEPSEVGQVARTSSAEEAALASMLEKFNTKVRSEWGPEVSQRLQSPGFIYRIGCFTAVPVLWEMCSKFDALQHFGPARGAAYIYFFLQYPLVVCPLILKGAFLVNQIIVTLFPRPQTRLALLARHVLVVVGIILQMSAVSLPASMISGSLEAQVAMYLIYIAVAVPVFCRHRIARWVRRLRQAPSAQASPESSNTEAKEPYNPAMTAEV